MVLDVFRLPGVESHDRLYLMVQFYCEYPIDQVAMDGRLQTEDPKILEALEKITSAG